MTISSDFCDRKINSKGCPQDDDDGSDVSCEWCKTGEVMRLLVAEGYGKMGRVKMEFPELSKWAQGQTEAQYTREVFEPIQFSKDIK